MSMFQINFLCLLMTGANTTCREIESWCRKWRMVVNGSKSELTLLNCEMSAINLPTINSDTCALVSSTKSIGLTIDDKLNYHEHLKKGHGQNSKKLAHHTEQMCRPMGSQHPTLHSNPTLQNSNSATSNVHSTNLET